MLTGRHYTLGGFWDIPTGDSPIFIPPTPGNTQVYIPPSTTIPPNTNPPVSPSPEVPTPATGAGTSAVETQSGGVTTTATEKAKAVLTSKPVLIGGGVALVATAVFAATRLLR